ncbi:MAG: hypothetical protein KDJ47_03015 [Hyphomicrobiaceae bacterium]|nr:hypothetical protein [Hyphomicrobiaceae bacterium]
MLPFCKSLIAAAALLLLTTLLPLTATPAVAQDAIDTTKIVRLPNSKELFAFPQSTSFTTSLSVPEALTALSTLLVADSWQPYERAFSSSATNEELAIVQFKKDRQLLSVMVNKAPAQNNATAISYTGLVTGHDLPFPKNANTIKYDPTRPYLNCISATDPKSLSDELREGLTARGWRPWSASEAKRVDNADQITEQGVTAFYVNSNAPSLRLSIGKTKDGQSSVTIEAISAEVLATVAKSATKPQTEAKEPDPPAKPEAKADAGAHNEPDPMKSLADDIMKEAQAAIGEALRGIKKPDAAKKKGHTAEADSGTPLSVMQPGDTDPAAPVPLPEGSEGIEIDNGQLEFTNSASVARVAAFYRSTMKGAGWKERKTPINQPNMVVLEFDKSGSSAQMTIMRMGDHTQVTATGSAIKTAEQKPDANEPQSESTTGQAGKEITADQLEADEAAGLPVPKQSTSKGSEKTMFRVSALADVNAPLQAVLGFYRRELGKRNDWQMQNETTDTSGSARIQFATPEGPAILTLTEKSGTTSVVLLVRKQKAAQASGLMPKPGQVKLLIGNILEKDAKLSLAKKTIKVGAGKGAKEPDGPSLEIKPGSYDVNVSAPGVSAPPEKITVGGDEIWGLIIGPGGVLPIQMY